VFHLDDDVTKDYMKGKDRGLLLEDRYERRKKKEMRRKTKCMVFVYTTYDLTNDRVWIIVRVGVY